ncbi:hypothetical protein J2792_003196 [Novosphingobium capsulatum]|uniref:Uncharacterized protein n=1 Tax=Novosphingobium capsulatum TaxID=13688 RepID=A0ABU1MPM9_9SPHN|nr:MULTISPECIES: hypothetical protein [Novosphingobium]KPF56867.1 hypothetical protein IP65_03985 [Novosphingobium sp. AAP1]MDR6512313.1 hypothetical protein [Novosphingobium capsulatum]PTR09879.1 hypothetical protein C8K11_108171 [Novosphingobium sp. GV055]PUB02666.1 hypothetical protein C8K12_108171 [Novosphingobium sp. GV061]PUB19611.1 hypothetical protein C8K14_108171 [Novosphingobium sp. GV079]
MLAKLTKIAGVALAAALLTPAAAQAHPQGWEHSHRGDHRGWDNRGWNNRGWDHRGDRRGWESRRWEHRRWERHGYARDCRIVWRHHERVRICR